ncbi:MAG: hypothetical protein AAF517_14160 [Planctomycetota bacterium]
MRNTLTILVCVVALGLGGGCSDGGGGGGNSPGEASVSINLNGEVWEFVVVADPDCSPGRDLDAELSIRQNGADISLSGTDVDLRGTVDGEQITELSGSFLVEVDGEDVTVSVESSSISVDEDSGSLSGTFEYSTSDCRGTARVSGARSGDNPDDSNTDPEPDDSGGDVDSGDDDDDDDSNPQDDFEVATTLAQKAVGAWFRSGSCSGSTTVLTFAYILCPGGRLRGSESVDDFDFVVCGTWEQDGDLIRLSYRSTDTILGESEFVERAIGYDEATDQLIVGTRSCNVPLNRLGGDAVDTGDCDSAACTAGGTGPVACGTDCDCGRCWYCEDGACHYGGEGPFGCFRGCPFTD